MNYRLLFTLFALISTLIFTACKDDASKGCTIACASNYDPDAEEDDGSCEGCTEPTSENYCEGVAISDNSCILPCETNNTGEVIFANNSTTNATYEVLWDSEVIVTLAPGESSETFTFSAGTYSLLFRNTSNNGLACTASSPVVEQCQTLTLDCNG